jgi:hypothetical protein
MLTLTPNKDLSNRLFLSDAEKNYSHQYGRAMKEEGLVTVWEFWFDWGPLGIIPEKTPKDIDREISAELLKQGLYHHKDNIRVMIAGTKEVSDYRYKSNVKLVVAPQKIRPPS